MAASNSSAAAKNELPAKPNAADVHPGTNKKLPQSGKPYAVQTVRPGPIRAIAVLNDSTMHRALRWQAAETGACNGFIPQGIPAWRQEPIRKFAHAVDRAFYRRKHRFPK